MNTTPTCTPASSALRTLHVLKCLKGHSLTGLSNGEIAAATGESAPNVTRALAALMHEGLAVKLESGRYAHGILMLQIAQAHHHHVETITRRAAEMSQRMTAGAAGAY